MEELTVEEEQQYFADAMGDMLGIYGSASDYSTKAKVKRGDGIPNASSTVQEAQKLLLSIYGPASLGSHGADGKFGGGTETLVKRFQGDQQLAKTGVVDSSTWAKLYEATGQGAAPKTKNEKAKDTIDTIWKVFQTNVLPMIGPKRTESEAGLPYVPPQAGPYVPPQPEKTFPWGMAIGGVVVAVVVVGGLIVVMKKG